MKNSEEKTGNEKYKLWRMLDYFFEKVRTDKSGKSIGRKIFTLGATAATVLGLLGCMAMLPTVMADDRPFAVDSKNIPDYTTTNYYEGTWLITENGIQDFSAIASSGEHDTSTFWVQVVNENNEVIAEHPVAPTYGAEEEVFMPIPLDKCYEGQYFIQVNNLPRTDPEITDGFKAAYAPENEIPEFPTVAVPLIASVLLVWGFMRKKKGL